MDSTLKLSAFARYFDESSRSWSREHEYNMMFLRSQQNYMNDILHSRGHVFLNDVYDQLGMKRTQVGSIIGWLLHEDGSSFISFGFDYETLKSAVIIDGAIPLDFNVDGVIYDKI